MESKKELITIQLSKYLSDDLAKKIALAQWQSDAPKFINCIREPIYADDYFYDNFSIVARNQDDNVIGRLYCIRNDKNKELWYYGDLFVVKEYQRNGIASKMIKAAINHLYELKAKTLCCYVEHENTASILLQKSMGFSQKPYRQFNDLENNEQIMFEYEFPCPYTIIPATVNEARFVTMFYRQNEAVLHGENLSLEDFKTLLSVNNKDTRNYLVCRGCMPVAWLQVSGLMNNDMPWISMLAVSDKHRQQGAGTFAVGFAEKIAKESGFSKIGIKTTEDNIIAQNLFRKCGFSISEHFSVKLGSEVSKSGLIFKKMM